MKYVIIISTFFFGFSAMASDCQNLTGTFEYSDGSGTVQIKQSGCKNTDTIETSDYPTLVLDGSVVTGDNGSELFSAHFNDDGEVVMRREDRNCVSGSSVTNEWTLHLTSDGDLYTETAYLNCDNTPMQSDDNSIYTRVQNPFVSARNLH